jgi:hypothetical protein
MVRKAQFTSFPLSHQILRSDRTVTAICGDIRGSVSMASQAILKIILPRDPVRMKGLRWHCTVSRTPVLDDVPDASRVSLWRAACCVGPSKPATSERSGLKRVSATCPVSAVSRKRLRAVGTSAVIFLANDLTQGASMTAFVDVEARLIGEKAHLGQPKRSRTMHPCRSVSPMTG